MLRERTAGETEILIGQERANRRMQEFTLTISPRRLIPAKFENKGLPEDSPDKSMVDQRIDIRYIYSESHVRTKAGQE